MVGFFSWECKCCNRPLISQWANEDKNKWMTEAVAEYRNGSRHVGEYDGYGRIDGDDGEYELPWESGGFTLYHKACWEAVGKPGYDGPSDDARCQGYFYPDNLHNIDPPKTKADVKSIHLEEAYNPWKDEGQWDHITGENSQEKDNVEE